MTRHSSTRSPAGRPGWVLVAHHDAADRMTIFRLVEREGHHATVAGDVDEVAELLRCEPFDLVLLDAGMVSDPSALKIIPHDAGSGVPVVIVAEADGIYDVARGLEMGAADFLLMPFDPVFLRTRIERILELERIRSRAAEVDDALRHVARFAAGADSDNGAPEDTDLVDELSRRTDTLGHLARVVQAMARRVSSLRGSTPAATC